MEIGVSKSARGRSPTSKSHCIVSGARCAHRKIAGRDDPLLSIDFGPWTCWAEDKDGEIAHLNPQLFPKAVVIRSKEAEEALTIRKEESN